MAKFSTCPGCGSNLDPGEVCEECKKSKKSKNDQEAKTNADRRKDTEQDGKTH